MERFRRRSRIAREGARGLARITSRAANSPARVAATRRAAALAVTLLLLAACGNEGAESQPKRSATQPAGASSKPAAVPAPARTPAARPQNIVLITLDTTRADALGSYGQSLPTSPVLDRLAREGVLFEQAFTSNPETLPSHATLFTARFPFAHGVRSNSGYVLPEASETLAEILKRSGYATAAEVSALVMNAQTRITQGFDRVRDPESPGVELKQVRYGDGPAQETKTRVASDISRRGIEFVRAHRERPFFLWLHYFDPHVPYSAPGRFNGRIPNSPYHAEVASADEEIGRFVEELERLGLREQTFVVVTSDHGEGLGEHGELTHSYFTWQSTMRVPLLFWGPQAVKRGKRVASFVRSVDIAPTLLALSGHDIPAAMQGESLRDIVVGEAEEVDLLAYGESIELTKTFGVAPLRFVARGKWKYVHKVEPALYDLENDPGETRDVSAEHPEVVAALAAELETLIAEGRGRHADAAAAVDAETRARLEALGYVVGADVGASGSPAAGGIDDLDVSGIDASEMADDVETIGQVHALIGREAYARALPLVEALRARHPSSAHLLGMHARLEMDLGRGAQAIPLLREALARDPKHLDDRQRLAQLLHAEGRVDEAIDTLRETLALELCADTVFSSLNEWLAAAGRFDERVEVLGRAASECPDSAATLNNLAWALATSPVASARDGARAIEAARRALAVRGADDPAYLDTLAAAHAEVGDFEEAIRVEERAIAILSRAGAPDAVTQAFRRTLRRFRAGQAVRDPAGNANP